MASSTPLQIRLAEAVRQEARGETVYWSGQPSAWRAFVSLSGALLVGILWTAAALFFVSDFLLEKLPGMLDPAVSLMDVVVVWTWALLLLILVSIGVLQMLLPFWSARKARRTIHALTDKRLMTITAGRTTQVRTIWLARIQGIVPYERRDGSGDLRLIFDHEKDEQQELAGIREVGKVESLLTGLTQRAVQPRSTHARAQSRVQSPTSVRKGRWNH
jgi:hypothetical protein